ncbi:DUF3533 domain-containing protein [Favolaschia claudopus]|uniref:DUF3533 domain-containing protein n=1 Tax=Favolaschia claudopus TaxID=2862362 RepID=A0AAV9Z367_9AGAR
MEKPARPPSRAASEETAQEATPRSPAPSVTRRSQSVDMSDPKAHAHAPAPFSARFRDKSPQGTAARAIYMKTMLGGIGALIIVIFSCFSIYWGALWQSPHHPLPGWIVDFDGGVVGQAVSSALSNIPAATKGVKWSVVPASQFSGGPVQVQNEIVQEKTWYAVTINAGASANLAAAVAAADASYNSSLAITYIGSEARNENIYRLHTAMITAQLQTIAYQFSLDFLRNISSSPNATTLLSTAPQLVARPIYFSTHNLRPFDIPVATAVTFVGLIYLLILSFFVVMVASGARAASGYEANLTLRSIILLRLVTSFIAYFFIALFYTLLSRAFQLPFDRRFGQAGLVIFWMLNWIGMLATGLALEAMITLLTVRFVPFFLIIWIITNVSVCFFPLPVLPHLYRYGYAFPFYNISRSVRAIVFGTKNDVGLNFGVLIAWVALSCLTLPLFQWIMRRRTVPAQRNAGPPSST